MTYRGKYKVKDISKYRGNHKNVVYRSLWERQVMRWCDSNSNVVWWNSETLVIPYRCATDRKLHRYFVDFQIQFKKGPVYCIEVKPEGQTKKPVSKQGKKRSKVLQETLTYAKNMSKWEAAKEFCDDRGWLFEIWTEKTLKSLGIKLILTK